MSNKWPIVKLHKVAQDLTNIRSFTVRPEDEITDPSINSSAHRISALGRKHGFEIKVKKRIQICPGDLVFSRLHTQNGAFAYSEGHFQATSTFIPLQVDETCIERRFLYWALHLVVPTLSTSDTVGRETYKLNDILAIDIPLPPLKEQQRIVSRIDEFATQIQKASSLRHEAAKQIDTILSSVVSTIISTEVLWATVQDIIGKRGGSVRSGPFGSQLLHEEFAESGIPAIGTRDVQVNKFKLVSGWHVTQKKFEQLLRYQVFPKDILCTIVGASIGRFCVVPDDIPIAFTTKHIQALTLNQDIVDPQFVSYMLNYHSRSRESLFSQVEGSAQPSLNAKKVLSTEIPIPPLSEQKRVVAVLDKLDEKVNSLKRLQIDTSIELDTALPAILDKAFKGEL